MLLDVAGEEGGLATMVTVFLPVLVCCGWLSHLFELVVCRKMVHNGRMSVVNSLRPILVRAGTENSLFFRLLRRNQYESFRRWRFEFS